MRRKVWSPSQDIVRHCGEAIPTTMDFFRSPPPQIGRVISAESSLLTSQKALSWEYRALFMAMAVIVGALVTDIIFKLTGLSESILLAFRILILITVAFVSGVIVYMSTRFLPKCSYVGEQGIAEFSYQGKKLKRRLLLFAEAKNLLVEQTRHYSNGLYTHTNYNYSWVQKNEKKFSLYGVYRSEEGSPDANSEWYFAASAEGAWNQYMLNIMADQLEEQGHIEFTLTSGNPASVKIGDNFMEFTLRNGESQSITGEDIKEVTLNSGIFRFTHQDATWWSGKGKYTFDYSKIPNAQLFLLCLDKLMGIHWE
ncbi:MAG: hypothetical protein AB4058_08685 [Microcystaceae cyanobacterium]